MSSHLLHAISRYILFYILRYQTRETCQNLWLKYGKNKEDIHLVLSFAQGSIVKKLTGNLQE